MTLTWSHKPIIEKSLFFPQCSTVTRAALRFWDLWLCLCKEFFLQIWNPKFFFVEAYLYVIFLKNFGTCYECFT